MYGLIEGLGVLASVGEGVGSAVGAGVVLSAQADKSIKKAIIVRIILFKSVHSTKG